MAIVKSKMTRVLENQKDLLVKLELLDTLVDSAVAFREWWYLYHGRVRRKACN